MSSKQQDLFQLKIKEYFGDIRMLKDYRPYWLKNPKTNKNLEIDIYIPRFKIGFEYQGYHHFEKDDQKYRDELKRELAKKRKVYIIEVFEQDLYNDNFIENLFTRCENQIKTGTINQLRNHVRGTATRKRKLERFINRKCSQITNKILYGSVDFNRIDEILAQYK